MQFAAPTVDLNHHYNWSRSRGSERNLEFWVSSYIYNSELVSKEPKHEKVKFNLKFLFTFCFLTLYGSRPGGSDVRRAGLTIQTS